MTRLERSRTIAALTAILRAGAVVAAGAAVTGCGDSAPSSMQGPVVASNADLNDQDGDWVNNTEDCDDGDPNILPGGPQTASFEVLKETLGCERQMATATFKNEECESLQITAIEIDEVRASTGRTESLAKPFEASIPSGQTLELDFVSDLYCCVGGKCTDTSVDSIRWDVRFRTSSDRVIEAGSHDWAASR